MTENNKRAALAVFSGKCLQAVCGVDTGMKDWRGNDLRTGDVVLIFTVRGDGDDVEHVCEGLTAVVSDEWTTYQDGRTVRKDGDPEFFVMGIKNVPRDEVGHLVPPWKVMRVKRYEDVMPGEHWREYGFSYGPVPESESP